jgi:hypothetical protein
METITENDLLAEILAEWGEPIQEGDVTARMVIDKIGVDHQTAIRLLDKMVRAGRGEWVNVRIDGRMIRAVRPK